MQGLGVRVPVIVLYRVKVPIYTCNSTIQGLGVHTCDFTVQGSGPSPSGKKTCFSPGMFKSRFSRFDLPLPDSPE